MANLLPLVLSAKCKNWRMNDTEMAEADAEFGRVRTKALDRDLYACRFCGFRAEKWQEVHHLNDDHADNRLQNLVTACQFCHACQHIGLAGTKNEGVIIWLPEIPQVRLNHLVRACIVADHWAKKAAQESRPTREMIKATEEMANGAQILMSYLRVRQEESYRMIGTSRADELANALLAMPDEIYDKRDKMLRGIRLLPTGYRWIGSEDMMPKIIESWVGTGGPFSGTRPSTWVSMLRTAL